MSNEKRLDKVEQALCGPGRQRVVTVHKLDPEREAKIEAARAACGPADKLIVVEVTGGYRGAQYEQQQHAA